MKPANRKKRLEQVLGFKLDDHFHQHSNKTHYCNLHQQYVDNCKICGYEIKPLPQFFP